MKLKSGHRRVEIAILLYLFVFLGLNLHVWLWYASHQHVLHKFPLGARNERFGDILRFTGKRQIGQVSGQVDGDHLLGTLFPSNYPPFAVVLYLFLLQVCAPYALFAFLLPILSALSVACIALWRKVRGLDGYRWYMGLAIFATGLFGWGTEQIVMRGNIEGFQWIAVCLGAALYSRRRYTAAAVAFGVACCIKPYPILWFALMVRHRRYREAAIGIAAAAVVTLASLFAIDPNPLRAYHKINSASTFFSTYIVAFRGIDEMVNDQSILQTVKTIARVIRNHGLNFSPAEYLIHPNDPLAWKIYHAYLPLAVLIGLVTFWRVWNKPVLNQIFALACVTTLLPLISAGYTLSLLLVPMGFFLIFLLQDVALGKTRMSLGQILWFLLPCAWIMATEQLNNLHGVLKCLALLILLVVSTSISIPSTLFGEIPRTSLDPPTLNPGAPHSS